MDLQERHFDGAWDNPRARRGWAGRVEEEEESRRKEIPFPKVTLAGPQPAPSHDQLPRGANVKGTGNGNAQELSALAGCDRCHRAQELLFSFQILYSL